MTTTNITISRNSLSGANFKEAIDLGLVCAAFDQQVNLIFVGDGLYNLVSNQSIANLKDKNHVDILKGIEFYDIENIFVEQESLCSKNLKLEKLIDSVEVKSAAEILELNLNADNLVSF